MEDLIKSCHKGLKCSNIDVMACDYLDEELEKVMEGLVATEAQIKGYGLSLNYKDGSSLVGFNSGNQTKTSAGGQRIVPIGDEEVVFGLTLYY